MSFRPEKLTVKAQEALQNAQTLGEQRGQQQIAPLHLLKTLLDEQNGIVVPLIQKVGANVPQLRSLVDSEVDRLPKVSGSNATVGASAALMQVLNTAQTTADQMPGPKVR